MKTKYGNLGDDLLEQYKLKLVGMVFKLLPMREESNPTLTDYHESLMLELHGADTLVLPLQEDANFLSLLCSLESLLTVDDIKTYRRKVFECITICKRLKM